MPELQQNSGALTHSSKESQRGRRVSKEGELERREVIEGEKRITGESEERGGW